MRSGSYPAACLSTSATTEPRATRPSTLPGSEYRAAVDLLMTLPDFERHARADDPPDYHLRRVAVLLEALGNPHLAVPTVHVAGSKGKGSTAAMIAAALAAHGLRVGLYTSPHLHTVRERIRVGLEPVTEREFAGLVDAVWPHVSDIDRDGSLGRVSFFDTVTAMAFHHFRATAADYQVIEVGLGGRLDATNLVQPDLSVITPIGLDHVAVLGDTVEKIAADKAGIVKPEAPVVIGRQPEAARRVIAERAAECRSPLHDAMTEIALERLEAGDTPAAPQTATLRSASDHYALEIPLAGAHQIDNARTAVAALEQLSCTSLSLSSVKIAGGLRKLVWPARVQVLTTEHPVIVADGAHNPDSAVALSRAVDGLFPRRRGVILIYGAGAGHDLHDTVRSLLALRPTVITTRSRHPKAYDAADVANVFVEDNVPVAAITATASGALARAKQLARPGDVIVATGSLFVAAEVIEEVQGIAPELYPTLYPTLKADSGGRSTDGAVAADAASD